LEDASAESTRGGRNAGGVGVALVEVVQADRREVGDAAMAFVSGAL
jgi:hypothetical protein